MAEKVEELLLKTLAASIEQREQMNALMAVMHQRVQQLSVDSKAAQPVQPVHEGLMGEFGAKTDVAQCSIGKSVADIDKYSVPNESSQSKECTDTHGPKAAQSDSVLSELNQSTECTDTHGPKAAQPESVPSELNQSKEC